MIPTFTFTVIYVRLALHTDSISTPIKSTSRLVARKFSVHMLGY